MSSKNNQCIPHRNFFCRVRIILLRRLWCRDWTHTKISRERLSLDHWHLRRHGMILTRLIALIFAHRRDWSSQPRCINKPLHIGVFKAQWLDPSGSYPRILEKIILCLAIVVTPWWIWRVIKIKSKRHSPEPRKPPSLLTRHLFAYPRRFIRAVGVFIILVCKKLAKAEAIAKDAKSSMQSFSQRGSIISWYTTVLCHY